MKRGISLLLAVVLIFGAGIAAASAESGVSDSIKAKSFNTVLNIDNVNLYDGMEKTYGDGYVPAVSKKEARIVVPFVTSQELENDEIYVNLGLGDPSNSPFEFENHVKTIKLAEHSVNAGKDSVRAYLADARLPIREDASNGRYPVTLSVRGTKKDGDQFEESYTLYVTLKNAESPSASALSSPDANGGSSGGGYVDDDGGSGGSFVDDSGSSSGGSSGSSSDGDTSQPKIMIEGYTVSPSPVEAGKEFKLSVKLKNTNEKQKMSNVKVTVEGETTDIIPVDKTNSFYFKNIGKKSSVSINIKMMAQQTAEPKPQKITFHVDYEGSGGTAYTSDESIVVQITQPIRLEFDEPEIPSEVNAGDTISLAVNAMNMGRGTVYNVRAEVDAPGLIPEGSAFLGNLESGASKSGDMYVFVGTLDSSETASGEKYGTTGGTLKITYENEFGDTSEKEFEFTTNINPPVIDTLAQTNEEEEQPKTQSQWWISVIILAVLIAAGLGVWYLRKQKLRKKAEEDEDG
ncbi:MAG: hypothetical protein U0K75_05025 [Christensenellaceae bacterium]|jgi:hypothetical protein|nr:hypothetical protein [Christensenellaceae bacterium]